MTFDSQRTKPSSSMVGTTLLGFMARYSGVKPKAPAMSMRLKGRSSSAQHHTTFCRLLEFVRPQIVSMAASPLWKRGFDHRAQGGGPLRAATGLDQPPGAGGADHRLAQVAHLLVE